jgi:hypothetical protein
VLLAGGGDAPVVQTAKQRTRLGGLNCHWSASG